MICAVFDPGAAHISRTLWCGLTLSTLGGIMETVSCREMLPDSVSDTRKLCSLKYASTRRISFRVRLICQAILSGYHSKHLGTTAVGCCSSPSTVLTSLLASANSASSLKYF